MPTHQFLPLSFHSPPHPGGGRGGRVALLLLVAAEREQYLERIIPDLNLKLRIFIFSATLHLLLSSLYLSFSKFSIFRRNRSLLVIGVGVLKNLDEGFREVIWFSCFRTISEHDIPLVKDQL